MVPRQARLSPAGMEVARISPKNGKTLAIYSCKKSYAQTKIYVFLSVSNSKIKN
jgi:hypothetical protein